MRKVFDAIKTKLQATPGIKSVQLYSNQLGKLESNEQIPFRTPAVLIQFLPPIYNQVGGGEKVQEGVGEIAIHLVENVLTRKDENWFVLRDVVHAALEGLQDTAQTFTPLTRVSESPDENLGNLTDWIMTYSVNWYDDSANHTYTEVNLTLALSKQIGID